MRETKLNHNVISHLTNLSIEELRREWVSAWGLQPHSRIGRSMLEKSLAYKLRGQGLNVDQQKRLEQLIKQYKRNPNCFDENVPVLKPGTHGWFGTGTAPATVFWCRLPGMSIMARYTAASRRLLRKSQAHAGMAGSSSALKRKKVPHETRLKILRSLYPKIDRRRAGTGF